MKLMGLRSGVVGSLLVGAVAPAQAGPNFREGMCNGGDAGSNPAGACTVSGFGNVATISGSIGGPPDLEDMYLIFISDPTSFSASIGLGTAFDTQLWLFRADPGGALDGLGLLANDDISALDDASMMGSMSDDGTGISLTTPGLYYLAISGGGGLGVPDPGRFPVALGLPIFDLASPTEISGPDGPGGMFAIDDAWWGEGDVGSYDIALEGVSFFELEPLCPWDCDSAESTDGTVGIVDFLALLAQWGGAGSCDFDGGGVGITDFLALLAHWGPCP